MDGKYVRATPHAPYVPAREAWRAWWRARGEPTGAEWGTQANQQASRAPAGLLARFARTLPLRRVLVGSLLVEGHHLSAAVLAGDQPAGAEPAVVRLAVARLVGPLVPASAGRRREEATQ